MLLVLRKEGVWSFPGGKLEAGESPLVAATRELYEETGVVADLIHHFGEFTVQTESNVFELNCYGGQWQAGVAVALSDASDVIWVAPGDVKNLELASHVWAVISTASHLISS